MRASTRKRLVVVGNGMAGVRTVQELIDRAPGRYDITIFGGEPRPNYDRTLLSAALAGEKSMEEIVTHPWSWYRTHDVALFAGDPVAKIEPQARLIITANGRTMPYDKLVLATGSKPLAPSVPGLGLPGVGAFRDAADTERMIAAVGRCRRAVVIGGGLLGLEAAWGLKRRGMEVTVVHLMPTLMERQLDFAAGRLFQRDLEKRGINFCTDSQTEAISGSERATGVRLADGRSIAADLVVIAIGIRPNVDLARRAALDVNRGIVVRDDMRTSDPDIYAVGECVEHRGESFGLVAPIWDQAKVCAAHLAGDAAAVYAPAVPFAKLKITGVDVFSTGVLGATDEVESEITFHDAHQGIYKKLVLRDDRIVGVMLYGDTTDGPWYWDLMRRHADVGAMRDGLIFGRSYVDRTDEVATAATADCVDANAAAMVEA